MTQSVHGALFSADLTRSGVCGAQPRHCPNRGIRATRATLKSATAQGVALQRFVIWPWHPHDGVGKHQGYTVVLVVPRASTVTPKYGPKWHVASMHRCVVIDRMRRCSANAATTSSEWVTPRCQH